MADYRFCPLDNAFKGFMEKFKNLIVANKQSLLEYHGVPVYQSMSMLKSRKGLMNTLATDGANKFDFTVQNEGQDVTIKTTDAPADSPKPAKKQKKGKAPPAPASSESPADSPDGDVAN
ncbi:hypothetical protein QVD17_29993 [Tagetes erecta]|uniref:FAS1 domain-containing protein n=1 Tax=Tagetes erecta TaxID=13708 RepID=A0AAD8K721_TARER|nr:hypothetical protein QVD17_29993 [Tagetes erecta]